MFRFSANFPHLDRLCIFENNDIMSAYYEISEGYVCLLFTGHSKQNFDCFLYELVVVEEEVEGGELIFF